MSVNFDSAAPAVTATTPLTLSFTPQRHLDDPEYYTHFTLSRYQSDGHLRSAQRRRRCALVKLFAQGCQVEPGDHLLTTGTRLANGSVKAHIDLLPRSPQAREPGSHREKRPTNEVSVIGIRSTPRDASAGLPQAPRRAYSLSRRTRRLCSGRARSGSGSPTVPCPPRHRPSDIASSRHGAAPSCCSSPAMPSTREYLNSPIPGTALDGGHGRRHRRPDSRRPAPAHAARRHSAAAPLRHRRTPSTAWSSRAMATPSAWATSCSRPSADRNPTIRQQIQTL